MHDFNHDGKNDYKDYIMYDKYILNKNEEQLSTNKSNKSSSDGNIGTILAILLSLGLMLFLGFLITGLDSVGLNGQLIIGILCLAVPILVVIIGINSAGGKDK